MQPRLKSGLWVQALIRRYDRQAIPATVVRRGDADAGVILVKINRRERGCIVLNRVQDPAGALISQHATGAAPVGEPTAGAYIARQVGPRPPPLGLEIGGR